MWNRMRAFFQSEPMDRELDAEVASHIVFATEENLRLGHSPQEARRRALVRFGGVEQARQTHREMRGLLGLDRLMQDLRHTFRTLGRDRGFTTVAVLILALGIGANIVVFSVVNTILLRPLPFHDPQQLVWLAGNHGKGGLSDQTYRVDAYEEFQRHNQSFQSVTGFVPYYAFSDFKLTGYGEPKPAPGVWVIGNFFQTMGIEPELGRLFTQNESVKGGPKVALLSDAYWRR